MRFRKSIKLSKHVRLNLSGSGIGVSVGGKGWRVSKMANGRTRTTLSIPGTGISHVSETSARREAAPEQPDRPLPPEAPLTVRQSVRFWAPVVLLAISCIAAAVLYAVDLQKNYSKSASELPHITTGAPDTMTATTSIGLTAPKPTPPKYIPLTPEEEAYWETYQPAAYILNTNTKVFHRSTCSRAPKNGGSTTTRDAAIRLGYTPCSYCDP